MITAPAKKTFRLEQCLQRVIDNRGKTPPLSDLGIELLEVNAISGGRKSPSFENVRKYVSEETYNKWFRSGHPKFGDTLISTVGAIGRVAFVQEERGCIAQNIVALRPKLDVLNGEFLYYYLSSTDTQNRLLSLNIGVAQPSLKVPHLLALEVEIPSIPEQKRIAEILSAYDELIENSQRRIKVLETMARNLYREWFVHYRYPGHENIPLIPSPLGDIPKGWEVKKLGNLISYNRQATKPGVHLGERLYVPIDCLPSKSLALLEAKPIEEAQSSLQLFEKRDILFGAMRPYFHKVVIAPFAGVTRTTCFVLKPARAEWHAFATMTAFQEATVAYANAHSQGATIPYAVWDGSLAEMPLVLPPDALLRRFEKHVAPMLEQISRSYLTLNNLRKTRDMLLPRLLSGQIPLNTPATQVA